MGVGGFEAKWEGLFKAFSESSAHFAMTSPICSFGLLV